MGEKVGDQKALYETVLKAQSDLGEGLVIVEDERIVYSNGAFREMSGYGAEELAALPSCYDLLAEEEKELFDERLRRRVDVHLVVDHYETAMLDKGGKRVDVECSAKAFEVGGRVRLVVLVRDITERKEGERRLQESARENARLNEELADRERRLTVLVARMLRAQEEERRRVAYNVHDSLAQVAVAAHQHLQVFARRHDPEAPRVREELERVLDLVEQTVDEARRVIADLRPTVLDDFGLTRAIGLRVEQLRDSGWEVHYEETLGDERLPAAVETALFRVAHEALTNVRKHANTTRVHLDLRRLDAEIRLQVRDFGSGFEPSAPEDESGLGERVGLSSMREQVILLGGEFKVRSASGDGTCVMAEIPLVMPATRPKRTGS